MLIPPFFFEVNYTKHNHEFQCLSSTLRYDTVTPHNGLMLLHIADNSTSPQGSNAKLPQLAKINSTIFKQETIKSWFSGIGTSINYEVIQPFQNAGKVIEKYNLAIQHNSLTQKGWERLLAQSDDSLKAYLTSIKGSIASMHGYNVALQGNITGFKKVSSVITQYNALSASGAVEQNTFATALRPIVDWGLI